MSYETVRERKRLHVHFVPDEDVVEHISDKQEGVKVRNTAATQRMASVKKLFKKTDFNDDLSDVWKEQDYVDVLGVDIEDPLKHGPGSGGGGSELYSFLTIKRSNKMAQVASEMARTPGKSVTFSTSHSPKEIISPPASNNRQSSASKTPSKGRKNEFISTTPHRLRKRLSVPNPRSDTESEYSASSSDEEEREEKDSLSKTPSKVSQTPARIPSKKLKKNSDNILVEEYFEAHSSSKVFTSDRTLQRLQTPTLDQVTLHKLLDVSPTPFAGGIDMLSEQHEALFYKWMLQLHLGFNIVLFGLGSKRNLIEKFRTCLLQDSLHIVINGFFPSITVKFILNSITEAALDHTGTFRSLLDQMNFIVQKFKDDLSLELYLLIHNLDSQMLRGDKIQQVLGQLASLPNIHLLSSIDHINAPLMWDQSKQSLYNWLWYETTTYSSYAEETSYENSLLVKHSGALALSSLTHVLRSLTPNARGIFRLLAEYQLANKDNPSFSGLSFQDFYQLCREAFLVNSDLTLRAQLTEFRDHKLIRAKKGADGVEYLVIPLDLGTLTDFLEMEDKGA
ncbi:origin recognition complex subunit 2 [Spea bombifrons]|uniref:origin recognition complex subunit 2 n=1 Tax=Spea bombifrons TaxID=233779 RepID=UPI00234B66AA|nr:origin recognition complex subunit 2 [Spea bombifrons]XP_053328242.1 origin recognition complex subunit 2 [Spea bombifrons]XP_053328243.1 origin recognition complex subunit 2 [Spea bombifrons]